MQVLCSRLFALLFFTACGTSHADNVQSYKATFLVYPTTSTALNTIVEYDRSSGNISVTHTSLDANRTVLDSGTKQLAGDSRTSFNSVLDKLSIKIYKDVYRVADSSAADSDGTSMNIVFSTINGSRSILIDTVMLSILPEPLADFYNFNISLQLSNL